MHSCSKPSKMNQSYWKSGQGKVASGSHGDGFLWEGQGGEEEWTQGVLAQPEMRNGPTPPAAPDTPRRIRRENGGKEENELAAGWCSLAQWFSKCTT